MVYKTLEGTGVSDIKSLLDFPNLDNPLFYPIFIFTVFVTFTSILYFKQQQKEGRGDILSSMAVSGFISITLSAILSTLGLISITTLVTTIVIILILQVVFLLTSRNN